MGNSVLKPMTLTLLFCLPQLGWAVGDRLHLEEGTFNLAKIEKPVAAPKPVPKFELEVKDGTFKLRNGQETVAMGTVEVVTDSAGRAFLQGIPDPKKMIPTHVSAGRSSQLLGFKVRYNYSKARHYLAKRPVTLANYREGTLVVEWLERGQRIIEKDKKIQIRKIEEETAQLSGGTLDRITSEQTN